MPTQETKSPSKTRNPKPAAPAYRQRAGYSQAIVTLTDAETRQRRDYWLGEFDQAESRERYHRVIAEWERRGRRLPPPDFDAPPARRADEITIVEVIREFWRWAADYYRPKHTQALDGALTILRQFYGRTAAIDFGPKKLRLLRDHMIRGDGSRRMPWSRKYINSQVQRIRHMFKWAAGHELVPVAVHQSLCTLEALRRGRCDAREGKKVAPVPQHLLDAVLPKLTKPVAALVKLQRDIEMDDKLGVVAWRKTHRFHPHQLRHNAATELRKAFGLEAAQLTLGHASAQITDAIYAERDRAKVIEIMRKNG